MLSPPSSKKLSSMPTRSSPSTSANSPHSTSSCGVRGSRAGPRSQPPAQAAHDGRACRSPSAADAPAPRSTTAPDAPAAPPKAQTEAPNPPPERRPRRRHHIAHQTPARAAVVPRHHAGLRHPATPSSAASISPGSIRKPRSLICVVGTPDETPAPRPNATAPGPRSGTSGCPQPRAGPRQTAPPSVPHAQDSPAQPPHPICKAPRQPQPQQAQANSPERKHACSRSDDRSGIVTANFIVSDDMR